MGNRQSFQTDPIGYDGGQNLYAYATEDPINLSDPTGNASEPAQNGPQGGNLIQASTSNSVVYIGYHQIQGAPDGVYHTFTVVVDPNNTSNYTYFRGGPSGTGAGADNSQTVADGATGTVNNGQGQCGTGGCGYGNVTVDIGAPAQQVEMGHGGPSFFTGPYSTSFDYATAVSRLQNLRTTINASNTGYGPLTTNSNTVTAVALYNLGVGHPFLGRVTPGY